MEGRAQGEEAANVLQPQVVQIQAARNEVGWLGQPTNWETDYAGRRVMHYHLDFGTSAGAYAYQPTQYGQYATAYASQRTCDLWFSLDSSNRVVNWSYRGNNCKAK